MGTFKVSSLSNLEAHNTVLWHIITMLCTSSQNVLVFNFKLQGCTFRPLFFQWHPAPAPGNHILLSVPMSLAFLDSAYKWYHTIFVIILYLKGSFTSMLRGSRVVPCKIQSDCLLSRWNSPHSFPISLRINCKSLLGPTKPWVVWPCYFSSWSFFSPSFWPC